MTSKHIATFITATAAAFLLASPVKAGGNCTDQYGSTVPCQPTNLNINKQVQDPVSGLFVENITTPEFSQGDTVTFKLTVTNNSGETFTQVLVNDGMPSNLVIDDVSTDQNTGVHISVSSDNKQLQVGFDQLTVNQQANIYVISHLVGAYPSGDSFCEDNYANVSAPARPNGDTNFARFCVANKVGGTTSLPVTGVEDLAYIIPFAITGIGGLALLKKK
jgi:uncharacterized repeat protein (TIGR01451 family)